MDVRSGWRADGRIADAPCARSESGRPPPIDDTAKVRSARSAGGDLKGLREPGFAGEDRVVKISTDFVPALEYTDAFAESLRSKLTASPFS